MQEYLVIYDAACGACSDFKRALDFLDVQGRIGFLSLGEAERIGLLDSVPPAARFRSFHLALPSGRVLSGGRAIPYLIRPLPSGRIVSKLISLIPFGPRLLDTLYAASARYISARACSKSSIKSSGSSIPTESRTSVSGMPVLVLSSGES